jgi:DNA replication protein DnaC
VEAFRENIALFAMLPFNTLGSYLGPDFVLEGRSLVLLGKTGRGKTHLAIAIGYELVRQARLRSTR